MNLVVKRAIQVFPTRVGMNREFLMFQRDMPSVPHSRGDEPKIEWGRTGWTGSTTFMASQKKEALREAYFDKQRDGKLIYKK